MHRHRGDRGQSTTWIYLVTIICLQFRKYATFNTLSLNPVGSSHLLSSELEKYGISIAGLTETRWPGVGEYTVNGYTYLWSGCDKHRVQGVAVALNKQSYSSLIELLIPISSRIVKARFNHHHGKLTVIVSYATTNLAKDNVKHGQTRPLQRPRHHVQRVPNSDHFNHSEKTTSTLSNTKKPT